MTEGPQAPPGWYEHPEDPGRERYWDGSAWGETRDKTSDGQPVEATREAPSDEPPSPTSRQTDGSSLSAVIARVSTRTKLIGGGIVVAIIGVVLVAQLAGENELQELAEETCDELEGAIVLQVGGIINSAVNRAERMGASGPELGNRMRQECPGVMGAVENIGEEQEREESLADEVEMVDLECLGDSAEGRVRNNNDVAVDVWVEIDFMDEEGGTVLEQGLDNLSLQPNTTGRYDVTNIGPSAGFCSGRIDTVRSK